MKRALLFAPFVALLGCGPNPPCGLRLCDIRQPDCQRAAAQAAACLRGQPALDVPVHVISQKEYIASSVASDAGNVDAAMFARWVAALALVGLEDPTVTLAGTSQASAVWVAAFYQPDDKTITVVDAGRPLTSRDALSVLIHENTHALQDATVGLRTFEQGVGTSLDQTLASKSITEGEATVVQDLATLDLFGTDPGTVGWPRVWSYWQSWTVGQASTSPTPVDLAIEQFPYPYGAPYVHDAYVSGGFAAVEALYRDPPHSSLEVMAGYQTRLSGEAPKPEDLGVDAVPVLPARFTLLDGDRLGAWTVGVFGARLGARTDPTLAPVVTAAGEVRADWFSLFRDSTTDHTVSCWRWRLVHPETATAVAQALTGRGSWNVYATGRDVVLLAAPSTDADVRALAVPGLSFMAVPAVTGGMPAALAPLTSRRAPGCLRPGAP